MDEYATLDATALAELVRAGEISALELVDAAAARMAAGEPVISALSAELLERARAAARAPLGDGPFAGVPAVFKDLNELRGAPWTLGSRAFARQRARRDSPAIAGMRAAGLIPVARTKTPEFGLLPTTEPLSYGPARNPWDPTRSPGGSSGGAGAAAAARYAPIAHAGDGGGSIRIPAAHCGVFGLKTSRHRLPRSRIQLPGDIQSEFCVTRSVRDSARLLAAIERRDGPLAPVGLVDRPLERPLRIVVSTRDGHDRDAEPEVRAAVAAAAALCESLGHHVAEGRPDLEHRALYEAFLDLWASVPESLIFGWRRLAIRLATGRLLTPLDQMFEPWTLGLAAWSRRRRAGRADPVAAALARFELEAAKYDAFFATQADVWITPVLREPPPPLGHLAPDAPFETLMARILAHAGHTPLHNALGAPAMSVPLHWTAEGLPIGVQFAARAGADGLLLGLALALEAAAPWAERAPPALFPAAQAPLPSP